MWIARDKDEKLWLYVEKPHRAATYFIEGDNTHGYEMRIDDRKDTKVLLCSDLFPEVTWENSPKQLKLS